MAAGYAGSPAFNHPDSAGVGPLPMNNPDGVRWSTAIGYLSQARHRLNLTVRGDCLVHRLLFDGTRAIGVLVESGGETFSVYGDEIVLSGGAIGSPQSLMLSGIGPAEDLNGQGIPVLVDLPGVGQNLRDHPAVGITLETTDEFHQNGLEPRCQLGLRYTAGGSHLRNDMIIFPQGRATHEGYYVHGESDPIGVYLLQILLLATGSGHLTITSRDPHVQPYLDYNYLTETLDRQRLREAVHICLELLEHDAYRGIVRQRVDPTDADLESDRTLGDWMMRHVLTGQHVTNTCKMGPASDPMAVVDQHGKVHGTAGLRVADASVMPDCVGANTNATTIVIGERISDFIKRGV